MSEDWLDPVAARRGFERVRAEDALAREIERRLFERLEYIKVAPQRVLDVGCGTGAGRILLRQRYPEARIVALDWSLPALRHCAASRSLIERVRTLFGPPRELLVAGDAGRLPFADGSFDLVWSNLALAWTARPESWLREWHRVLKVGGLLMFTTYGPDTLRTLREAFAEADALPHVHPFVDMHDLGDALVGCRYADPVMDMEMLTLTYPSVEALLRELHAIGYRNAHRARRRGLTGRRLWARMIAAYKARSEGERIPAGFEIVYGHAWKAAPRETADGRQIIRFHPRPERDAR